MDKNARAYGPLLAPKVAKLRRALVMSWSVWPVAVGLFVLWLVAKQLFRKRLLPVWMARIWGRVHFFVWRLTLEVSYSLGHRVEPWKDVVEDRVWLGKTVLARHVPFLRRLGITRVLNMQDEYEGPVDAYKQHGIEQLWVPVVDHHEPSVEQLHLAVDFVEEALRENRKVYVHCLEEREMQVLTNRGFLFLHEIEHCYDPVTRLLKPGCDLMICAFDADADAYRFEQSRMLVVNAAETRQLIEFSNSKEDGSTDVSLMVTQDHDMWARVVKVTDGEESDVCHARKRGEAMRKIKAGNLLSHDGNDAFKFRAFAEQGLISSEEHELTDQSDYMALLRADSEAKDVAFLELLGFCMVNGKSDGVGLAVTAATSQHANFIEKRAGILGLDLGSDVLSSTGRQSFLIVNGTWTKYLLSQSQQVAVEGRVPDWLIKRGAMAMRSVVRGMAFSQGCGAGQIVTAFAAVRDAAMQMCLFAGFAAHFTLRDNLWRVEFGCGQSASPTLLSVRDARRVERMGRTWCVSVASGLIVVRRAIADADSGAVTAASRPVVTGNCQGGHGRSAAVVFAHLALQEEHASKPLKQVNEELSGKWRVRHGLHSQPHINSFIGTKKKN